VSVRVGLGSANALLNVYIANRPPLERYQKLENFIVLGPGEIASIAKETGNHWRKIFNVYAKLVYGLDNKIQSDSYQKKTLASFDFGAQRYETWQFYRDAKLLQLDSDTALWFSREFEMNQSSPNDKGLHIIMGRQYASSLNLPAMTMIDNDFSVNSQRRVIVAPYFDYRQLSNKKLEVLISLIAKLFDGSRV